MKPPSKGDIVKFSGWRYQAASSTLSPSSNLYFMLMTSAIDHCLNNFIMKNLTVRV